jgi:hypothetical protein
LWPTTHPLILSKNWIPFLISRFFEYIHKIPSPRYMQPHLSDNGGVQATPHGWMPYYMLPMVRVLKRLSVIQKIGSEPAHPVRLSTKHHTKSKPLSYGIYYIMGHCIMKIAYKLWLRAWNYIARYTIGFWNSFDEAIGIINDKTTILIYHCILVGNIPYNANESGEPLLKYFYDVYFKYLDLGNFFSSCGEVRNVRYL